MKAHSPCYLWWPKDILADGRVNELTLEEEGAYRRLIDWCWIEGSIPSHPARLGPLVRIDTGTEEGRARAEGLRNALAPFFAECPEEPGRWIQPRLEQVRAKALREWEGKRAGGKARAAALNGHGGDHA